MSCLFDSIGELVGERGDEVRRIICDYLEEGKPIMDGIPTKDILSGEDPHYIQKMRMGSEWGGGIEIQASCNIWKLHIIVYNIKDGTNGASIIEFLPLTARPLNSIRLCWNGEHYTAMK
jgi:hypothetical protein